MSRGDRREGIFLDDVDRYDFLQPGRAGFLKAEDLLQG
jgi:hypothetical protein